MKYLNYLINPIYNVLSAKNRTKSAGKLSVVYPVFLDMDLIKESRFNHIKMRNVPDKNHILRKFYMIDSVYEILALNDFL